MDRYERTCPQTLNIDKLGRITNYDKKKKEIREELIKISQCHCTYCDCLLHIEEYIPEIEHFRPKMSFPLLKKVWHNLFISCPKCNSIKEKNSRKFSRIEFRAIKLLKPDKPDYSFDYWFEIEHKTSRIKPNVCRTFEEQEIADKTINTLGLNEDSRPKAREKVLKDYLKDKNDIDYYSYRFFIIRSL